MPGKRTPGKRPKKRPQRSSSAPAVLKSPTKKERKQWSNESMLAVLEAVKKGLPVRKAATQYGVPMTTLQARSCSWQSSPWEESWS